MWTDITWRQHSRTGLRYPSDLRDAEWSLIEPLFTPAKCGGRPRATDLREVLNAILYLATSGCRFKLNKCSIASSTRNLPRNCNCRKGFDDRLKWLIGAFYDHETGTHRDFLDVDLFDALNGGAVNNDSVAVYTQETYEITSKLSLTAGVRWTDDTKRFTPDQYIVQDLGLGIPAGTPLLPNT